MAMTVDDIYFAALEGNRDRLGCLLVQKEAEELLEETITADVEGIEGMVSEFTVAFSILSGMVGNVVRYDMLDMLIEAGMDLNHSVVLKQAGCTKIRPILEYAISVWEDPELVEYLIKNGADVNAEHKEKDALGRTSTTTMLWYALNYGKEMQMMELLLKYGADPDKCCRVYDEEVQTFQYLPPLFYSLVANGDFQKTVCLIRYGASIQCGIDVGAGIMHNTNFKKYLSLYHPNLSSSLANAFEVAQESPKPEILVQPKTAAVTSKPATGEQVQAGEVEHKLNAGSKVTSLRRCYGKLAAYCFANFGFIALGGIIAALITMKSDSELGLGFLIVSLPCALVAAAIWSSVQKKAKARGQDDAMLQFVGDSVLVFAKVLLMMTIILIPLVKSIGSNIQWEERRTASGGSVMVKKTGDGTYEDYEGNRYVDKD